MIEEVVSIVIGFLCFIAVIIDIEIFACLLPPVTIRKLRYFRLFRWLPCAITYAFFYMSRYCLLIFATQDIFTESEIGLVYTVGFWTYAFCSPIFGAIVDKIDNLRFSLLLFFSISACIDFCIGLYLYFIHDPNLTLFTILYCFGFIFQSGSIASIVKITAYLYKPSEKGVFYGVFNVIISSGYFLSLYLSNFIADSIGVAYVFLFISFGIATNIVILFISLYSFTYIRNTEYSDVPYSFMGKLGRLFDMKMYVYLLFLCITSSWVLQGLLTTLFFFIENKRESFSDEDRALVAGAVTIGSIMGGLSSGMVSDFLYKGHREKTLMTYCIGQFISLFLLYFLIDHDISVVFIMTFFCFLFIVGQTTIISFTLPSTLDQDLIGLGGGILTMCMYISSGIGSIISSSLITSYGYLYGWIISLWIMTVISFIVIIKSLY